MSRHAIFRWMVLGGCFAVIVFTRIHTLEEPVERDLAGYAVTANELLHGKSLYSGVWDHKPPAVHLTYASAIALFGYGPQVFPILGVLTALVTLAGVYSCAQALGGDHSSGIWAVLSWSAISGNLGLEANQPNVEVFMNAGVVWFSALLLSREHRRPSLPLSLALGVIAAVSSLFKQVALLPIALLLLAYVLALGTSAPGQTGVALARAAVVGLVVAGSWLVVGAWYYLQGHWQEFFAAVFRYNQFYAGDLLTNLREGFAPGRLLPAQLWFCWPLAALGLFWVASEIWARQWRGPLAMAALATGTWLAVALPGHFFPHYYQLWLPLLAVGAGLGLASASRLLQSMGRGRGLVPRFVTVALGGAALGVVMWHELPALAVPAQQWPILKYRVEGELICEIPTVAHRIDRMLRPGEVFFHWGTDPGFYFYSRRRPPVAVTFCNPLFAGPLASDLDDSTLKQLKRAQPALVVVDKRMFPWAGRESRVVAWILENYRALEPGPASKYFQLFCRKGGRLDESGKGAPGADAAPSLRGGPRPA